jgi:hypothetical protein
MLLLATALLAFLPQKTKPEVAPEPGRFYEVSLPAGDHGSINIGWFKNGAEIMDPKTWLDEGYVGIRFTGQGIDKTNLRCTSWDGVTIAVGRHPGIVAFRDLTVYAGSDRATALGQQNTAKVREPKFQVNFSNVRFVANPPVDGKRTKWLVFSYNADLYLRSCVFAGVETAEHALYAHGFASRGMLIEGCKFMSSGAEGIKVRSDVTETVWAGAQARIVIRDTYVGNWHQPHSWRGGAGMVFQGAGCDILIERCVLRGSRGRGSIPANDRSKAIMISSEGLSYDAETGAVNVGYGNGDVVIRDTIAWGHSDVDWRNTILRCDRNSGAQFSAKSLLVENCGLWGQNMAVTAGALPAGKLLIRGCNTPDIKRRTLDIGLDATYQAYFPTSSKKLLISEGVSR